MRILILDTETNGLPQNRWAPPTEFRLFPAILQLSWAVFDWEPEAGDFIHIPAVNRNFTLALDSDIPWDAEAAAIHGMQEESVRRPPAPTVTPRETLRSPPAVTPRETLRSPPAVTPRDALVDLAGILRTVDLVIAHNLAFDKPIIKAAGYRVLSQISKQRVTRSHTRMHEMQLGLLRAIFPPGIRELCTMSAMRDIMKLPATAKQAQYAHLSKYKSPSLSELYLWTFGRPFIGDAHTAAADVGCLSECVASLVSRGILTIKVTGDDHNAQTM